MTTFVGTIDATERVLADGGIIIPGVPFELKGEDLNNPHNKRLIDESQIIELKPPKKKEQGE